VLILVLLVVVGCGLEGVGGIYFVFDCSVDLVGYLFVGAFYVFPDVSAYFGTTNGHVDIDNADDFAQWLLEHFSDNGETVMVAPASGFYSVPELGKKQVRIAYVLKEEDLRRSVELIKIALEQYKK
jgi:aspartate/methionine/tyrosine aminotransferase